MTDIRTLDEATIAKIAAGEVVERPASVAKELVENSLDAEASRIDVTAAAGGTELVRVSDDGTGMAESAVRRAIEQHTTSKIESIDDLETGVETLGFRGEALHTIGAVSKMTITTRPREGPDVGTELRVEGGEVVDVAPAGRAPGTTVAVEDLFFNTPARRKYLKQEATEFARLNRVVTRYALANPDVAVSLSHGDSEVFATTGQGDRRETIMSVYGREVAESMIGLSAAPDEAPVAEISGFVSDPETTRSGSQYVSTYVNGRYVREGLLREAIVSAYGNQLAADRYPFAVLFLTVPPDTVDVNVHPRKLEVRFDADEAVSDALESAVRAALLDQGLIRTGAPRGRSAPDETEIVPTGGEDGAASGQESADANNVSRSPQSDGADRTSPVSGPDSATPESRGGDAAGETRGGDGTGEPVRDSAGVEDVQNGGPAGGESEELASFWEDATDGPTIPESAPSESEAERGTPSGGRIQAPTAQTELGSVDGEIPAPGTELELDTLPSLRVLGQVLDTYVVAETAEGLLVIDQHAADERVQYERLADALADRRGSQRLVEPVRLSVTPEEASLFEAAAADLGEVGFEARLDSQDVVVDAVPAVFADTVEPALVREVLGSFLEQGRVPDVVDSAADALLADMACYPAITGNMSLRDGDILTLLRALDDCENPYACPHGRPVIIELSAAELEDRFERDYPGHATRRPEE